MTIRYRALIGRNLIADEIDENFTTLVAMLNDAVISAGGSNITGITMTGSSLTLYRSDGTTEGPFSLAIRSRVVTKTVSAATYTLLADDVTKNIRCTYAGAVTVTIPTNASVPIPVASEFHFRQAGSCTGVALSAAGVTLNGVAGFEDGIATAGASMTIKKIATDEWDVFGLLEPTP